MYQIIKIYVEYRMQNIPNVQNLPRNRLFADQNLEREQFDNLKEGKYYYMESIHPDRHGDYVVKVVEVNKMEGTVRYVYILSRGYKRRSGSNVYSYLEYLDANPKDQDEDDEMYLNRMNREFLRLPYEQPPVPFEYWDEGDGVSLYEIYQREINSNNDNDNYHFYKTKSFGGGRRRTLRQRRHRQRRTRRN